MLVALARIRRRIALPSVSALLLLAGDEEQKLAFPTTLLKQVDTLRKDLEKGDGDDTKNDSDGGGVSPARPIFFPGRKSQQSVLRFSPFGVREIDAF